MRRAQYVLGLALLVAVSFCLLPALQAADEPVADSPEVTSLLKQAQDHAVRLNNDAELMESFSRNPGMSWQSHAAQVNMIKTHINNLGKVLQQLSDQRESASPWQQKAIDNITPLAGELASDVETTINHINDNQERLFTPQYRDYLKANSELTASLSGLIKDYVSYGKSKAKYEGLGSQLETPGQ